MSKWFINSNNFIKGPFTSEEVQSQVRTLGDEIQTTFIWSRGHSEWTRADKWSPDAQPEKNKPRAEFTQTGSSKAAEVTFTPPPKKAQTDLLEDIKARSVEKFRVQYDFVEKGEMTREELTQFTAKQEDVSKIAIYDKKDKEWKEIYTLPDIVQRLGITRRQHQRVPILAQFSGTVNSTGSKLNCRIITISNGGMGITDNFDLKLGEIIQGQLTSPHFYSPLTLTAEVTYAGLDGYVGLKFNNMNDEMQALVTDYINRFGKNVEDDQ